MHRNSLFVYDGFYLSATRLDKFKSCNKCYLLEYELGVPVDKTKNEKVFAYGNLVHNSLEANLEGKDTGAIEEKFLEIIPNKELLEIGKKQVKNSGLAGGWKDGVFPVQEMEFLIETDFANPYNNSENLLFYGFFDYVEVEGPSEYFGLLKGVRYDGKRVLFSDKNGNRIDHDFKIKRLGELKTGARRSYRKIMESTQFRMYKYVLDILTSRIGGDPLFFLQVFLKDGDIQKELVKIGDRELGLFEDDVNEFCRKVKDRDFDSESTCSFFSDYKDICKDFII